MNIRRHIDFSGIVQGVGFRPYVYRLATEYGLAGTIHNTSSGVTVEVEGPNNSVQDFLARIPQNAPPFRPDMRDFEPNSPLLQGSPRRPTFYQDFILSGTAASR